MKTPTLIAAWVAVTVFDATTATQPSPAAAEVVRAAADYVSGYAPRVSGVTLEEHYTMADVSSGRMLTPVRLTSDLVILNLAGRVIALRDPFAIDAQPLRPREPRIAALLATPTLETWKQAQAFVDESMYRFPTDLIVKLNEPTLALQVLLPENQSNLAFTIEGGKRMDGVETVGLRFVERKSPDPHFIFTTRGNALASGKLWVDPATGVVHRTDLSLQSETETARISVTYTRDRSLDLWLPDQMFDDYVLSEPTGTISNMGAGGGYNARRAFECRATYSHPRLTPIELTIAK